MQGRNTLLFDLEQRPEDDVGFEMFCEFYGVSIVHDFHSLVLWLMVLLVLCKLFLSTCKAVHCGQFYGQFCE